MFSLILSGAALVVACVAYGLLVPRRMEIDKLAAALRSANTGLEALRCNYQETDAIVRKLEATPYTRETLNRDLSALEKRLVTRYTERLKELEKEFTKAKDFQAATEHLWKDIASRAKVKDWKRHDARLKDLEAKDKKLEGRDRDIAEALRRLNELDDQLETALKVEQLQRGRISNRVSKNKERLDAHAKVIDELIGE